MGAKPIWEFRCTGCPNFFMMYGPNTNASASIIYMLEHQAEYIAQCVGELQQRPGAWMHVRQDVQRTFNEAAHKRLTESVVARDNCLSYFKVAERQDRYPMAVGNERLSRPHDYTRFFRL